MNNIKLSDVNKELLKLYKIKPNKHKRTLFLFPVSCSHVSCSRFCIRVHMFLAKGSTLALSQNPGLHGNHEVVDSWKSWKCISHYLFLL